MSDEPNTRRGKKSDKARRNFELNGKYSAKHVRQMNAATQSSDQPVTPTTAPAKKHEVVDAAHRRYLLPTPNED
ncbi:hypothetical protein SPRG_09345 [Saprolegnia parasitica CBS 223.65]|uniref:Uncharacterized protein n=1 Tax=Saprolegnia parasitica (strain CBS 223.65) TaxID=695850 RepID=A0A067C4F3_SAPPC|nr:hypothetical protein SPRG_09345 [Saprolegnia parasitica CBS 223.65]KDO25403.1 hypothetical protein SPRG_09345 [Saprolegnia parasitica CBS 223.65]|eukprot:XP_012203831.1 hypothetical protein SPRG_09345 [Saprolegnia parasitica CBS 223.65]